MWFNRRFLEQIVISKGNSMQCRFNHRKLGENGTRGGGGGYINIQLEEIQ